MVIIRSAIFILLLIWCYQILTQYEEIYEHHMCHGAHTREEQEHGDEDVNSNNSL